MPQVISTNICRITKIEKLELIRLVTDLLLTLYREGWEPMTPIDTAVDKADRSGRFKMCPLLTPSLWIGP